MTTRTSLRTLNVLHVLNDGFYSSFLLFLPFLSLEFGMTLTQAGLLGSIVHSLGMLCALPSGYLAMRIGGMRLLIVSAVLYAVGYAALSAAHSFWWLIPIFVVAGIGFALFHPVAFALVTRLSAPKERGRNMGNFTAIGDVGKIGISSALTFIVAIMGWRWTAMAYGAVALAFGVFFVLRERRHRPERAAKIETNAAPLRLREILSFPPFLLAIFTSFFDVFSSASLFVFLPFLLLARGIDPAFIGSLSAVFFVGNLVGKTVLGRFSDRFSNAGVVMASELLMAVCIFLLAGSTSLPAIALCAIVAGIFTKGTVPVIQTMIASASEHHGHFERSFAVSGFVNAIAMTLSPVLFGFISDQWNIAASFHAMAIVALLAIVPAFLFRVAQVRA